MRQSIKSKGPGKPMSVPQTGAASRVGPSGAAPTPRLKNTRDYGKPVDLPPPVTSPNPFGPSGGVL